MDKPSESAPRLADMINKAIDDGKLTNKEYQTIIALAEEDHRIDPEERALLKALHEMLEDKTVVRVP